MRKGSNPPPANHLRPKAPPAPPKVITKVINGYGSGPDKLDSVYYKPSPQYLAYYLDSDIEEPSNYRELTQALDSMQEGDHLTIYINCHGGYLHTTSALFASIQVCKGHVHTVLNGVACSGGGIIFLAGHSCEVYPHSTFMAHASLGGVGYQKLPDTTKRIEHDNKQLKAFYEEVYKYFMTEDEIAAMLDGKDFWFDAEELNVRLTRRDTKIQEEMQQAQAQSHKDMEAMFDELDPPVPEAILKKLTKQQLIDYIAGKVDIIVNEDGTFEVMEIENEDSLPFP
jgi:ATP-dependent protease ClpP protease subunit